MLQEKGNRGVAAVLGVNSRTVASCMRTAGLSWRMIKALERCVLTLRLWRNQSTRGAVQRLLHQSHNGAKLEPHQRK